MLDRFLFILRELQSIHDELVALDDLARGEAHRNAGRLRVILDKMHDAVQAAVHRAAVCVTIAEIRAPGTLLVFGDVHAMLDQLVHTLIFRC